MSFASPRLPLAVALLATFLASPALADEQQRLPLRIWMLRLPGTELGLDLADMDGDGDRDLVIAHMVGPQRAVSVYLQGTRPRFSGEAAWTFTAPVDACAFLAGDFDPSPGGEVLFLCPGRLVIGRGRGELSVLATVSGFFDYPEDGGLPVYDLTWDLDGDGRLEVLVPTKDGYVLFGRGESGPLTARGALAVPTKLTFGPSFEGVVLNRFLTASSRLRRLVAADLDGDGRTDLVAYRDKGLARFLQREDGSFPERPDDLRPLRLIERVLAEQAKKDGEGGGSEAFDDVRLGLQDVDGDGQVDLLVTRTLGEMGVFESIRTQQLVFRGKPGERGAEWDEDRPDATINLKGVSDDPLLLDWDGDGKRDLIVSTYRMDLFTNVKRALFKSFKITYMIFRQRAGERPFADEPDFTLDLDVPLEVLQRRGGLRAALFTADVDGDGVRDRVTRGDGTTLTLVRGRVVGGEVEFDEDRPVGLAVGRTEPPWAVDLDGDGADELILEPFAATSANDDPSRIVRIVGLER